MERQSRYFTRTSSHTIPSSKKSYLESSSDSEVHTRGRQRKTKTKQQSTANKQIGERKSRSRRIKQEKRKISISRISEKNDKKKDEQSEGSEESNDEDKGPIIGWHYDSNSELSDPPSDDDFEHFTLVKQKGEHEYTEKRRIRKSNASDRSESGLGNQGKFVRDEVLKKDNDDENISGKKRKWLVNPNDLSDDEYQTGREDRKKEISRSASKITEKGKGKGKEKASDVQVFEPVNQSSTTSSIDFQQKKEIHVSLPRLKLNLISSRVPRLRSATAPIPTTLKKTSISNPTSNPNLASANTTVRLTKNNKPDRRFMSRSESTKIKEFELAEEVKSEQEIKQIAGILVSMRYSQSSKKKDCSKKVKRARFVVSDSEDDDDEIRLGTLSEGVEGLGGKTGLWKGKGKEVETPDLTGNSVERPGRYFKRTISGPAYTKYTSTVPYNASPQRLRPTYGTRINKWSKGNPIRAYLTVDVKVSSL